MSPYETLRVLFLFRKSAGDIRLHNAIKKLERAMIDGIGVGVAQREAEELLNETAQNHKRKLAEEHNASAGTPIERQALGADSAADTSGGHTAVNCHGLPLPQPGTVVSPRP